MREHLGLITPTSKGTVNFFLFAGVAALCGMWVAKQNVTRKLPETLFEEAFSGDGYEVKKKRSKTYDSD